MNRNILSSLIGCVVLLVVGCAPKRVIINPVIQPTPTPAPAPVAAPITETPATPGVESLQKTDVTYTTLSLKGKAKLNIDGEQNNVNINIRIKDKEMIWVSVSAPIVGEVARVLITPDSIKIVNRLQTTYTRKPFTFIHGFTTKQLTFPVLQAIISGNTIPQFLNASTKTEKLGEGNLVSGNVEGLVYKFLFDQRPRLQQTELNDAAMSQALNVAYSMHQPYNGMLFPGYIDLNSLAGAERIAIQMEFSAIEGNVNLQFPFSVNARFKVIN